MEYVRDTDKTHNGYKYYIDIQDQLNKEDVKIYVSRLTTQQKADLEKYKTLLRQRKFSSIEENKDKYNDKRNEYIKNLRATEPEKMAIQNKKDVKNHRLRNKAKEEAILNKLAKAKETEAKQTLTEAIRARRARAEMNKLKEKQQNKEIVKDIINDIIDIIPKKAQQKKNRESVAKHREKKQTGEPVKKYNTRTKAKK